MRRFFQLSLLWAAAFALTACDLEEVVETEDIPTAGVRFLNALPDTQAVDFRFVDIPENSAHWNIAFRNNPTTTSCVTASTQVQYKNVRAGSRHFRIFLSDTIQAIASTVVKDSTFDFTQDKQYTVLLWGRSRSGATPAMRTTILDDAPPDPGNQVALRFINASSMAVDVRHYLSSATVPATATWTNVAPLSVTSYVLTAPGTMRYNVQPAGGGNVLADAPALSGAAGTVGIDPLPGTTIAGSAVSGIFFDPPVAGSDAPQGTAFRTTTGSTSLSATATGYARASGSFISDCFRVGMEITASGFTDPANNGTSVITAMNATSLTVTKATPTVAEAAAASRTINAERLLSFVWDRRPPRI